MTLAPRPRSSDFTFKADRYPAAAGSQSLPATRPVPAYAAPPLRLPGQNPRSESGAKLMQFEWPPNFPFRQSVLRL